MKENISENKNIVANKKKKNIVIILTIVLLMIAIGFWYYRTNAKERKAQEIFGNEACEAILHMTTMDIAEHQCKICGNQFKDSSMHADICKQCAEETSRCEYCGKKLSKELKEQRENIAQDNE